MGEMVCEEEELLQSIPEPVCLPEGPEPDQSVMPPAPDPSTQVCEPPGVIDMSKGPQSVAITEPTTVKSTLGNMQVYPDDFVGPLPPGAVRASEHSRMLGVMSGIESGKSQISIDTSNFTAGIDPLAEPEKYAQAVKDAQAFQDQYTDYMKDLVKTPTGLTMLEELHSSKHKTKIEKGNTNETRNDTLADSLLNDDKSRNVGTGSTVVVDPNLVSYKDPGQAEEDWMTERQRYGFYHELVHAYHDSRGETAKGSHNGIQNWEWQVMGMGDFSGEAVSDNAIRRDMGKQERPNYGGVTW